MHEPPEAGTASSHAINFLTRGIKKSKLNKWCEAGTENRPHNIDLKRILVIRFIYVAPYVAPDISAAFWDSNPHKQAKKYFLILIERALN